MKKGSEKQRLRKTLVLIIGIVFFSVIMSGFGYFFGRLEQIELNKSLLKIIPDVNCGTRKKSDKKPAGRLMPGTMSHSGGGWT